MKKFITSVPLQSKKEDLKLITYQAVGNQKLQMEEPTSFPILAAVNGYVQPGEEFRLIAALPDLEAARRNCGTLGLQLEELCRRRGILCPRGVETVPAGADQRVATHVETFQRLLDFTEDNDELFVCMTFGTKPQAQAMVLAAQYAYRVKHNASLSCIVYGEVARSDSESQSTGRIYDMTALTQLDEIVHMLAERGVADPQGALSALFSL